MGAAARGFVLFLIIIKVVQGFGLSMGVLILLVGALYAGTSGEVNLLCDIGHNPVNLIYTSDRAIENYGESARVLLEGTSLLKLLEIMCDDNFMEGFLRYSEKFSFKLILFLRVGVLLAIV